MRRRGIKPHIYRSGGVWCVSAPGYFVMHTTFKSACSHIARRWGPAA